MPTHSLRAVVVLWVGAVCLGCGPDDGKSSTPPSTRPTVDRPALDIVDNPDVLIVDGSTDGDPSAIPENLGTAPVTVDVVTLNGGELATAQGRDGGSAFGFPAYAGPPDPPRAVISVATAESGTDPLSPGLADFEFGADFSLDEVSTGDPSDDGDNLVQRGLSSDPYAFKAQLDARRPGCLVRGSEGELSVTTRLEVVPGRWYRLRCLRDDDGLTVRVVEYLEDGTTRTSARQVSGPLGDVRPDAGAPLSIGGKLSQANQVIRSASDQFNGVVDNAIVVIN